MKEKYKFQIIPHTHWDREWYFTTNKSIIYSLIDFKEIIEHLKESDDFKYFLLDGQTSIIDDYLNIHPEDEELIKKLIADRRLFTGPWYTQTDQLVISGESIARNVYYGQKRANELGHCMMVGYMPDSFGQGAQMPQIYNGFNIENLVFRRGLGESQMVDSEFYWESEDGSKVFTHNVKSYANMHNPSFDREELKNYFDDIIKELGEVSPSKKIFLMNGTDQKPIRKELPDILNIAREIYPEYEFEITNLEDALKEMKSSCSEFKTYKGEMTIGQFSRVHKSIFSSRADLKIMNNKAENFITNIGEPLASLSHKLGFKYEHKIFEQAWKLLCENAAHDSIGMCNSDRTNLDVEYRYKKVIDLIENLNEITMRLIGMSIEEKDIFQFQVYNLLPYQRSAITEIEVFTPSDKFKIKDCDGNNINYTLISSEDVTDLVKELSIFDLGVDGASEAKWTSEDVKIYKTKMYIDTDIIPSLGYKTLFFEEDEIEANKLADCKSNIIENDLVKLTLSDDGTCSILDKVNKLSLDGLLVFENSGDDGDTYDYSEPYKDLYLYSNDNKICDLKTNISELKSSISFKTKIDIPSSLKDREYGVLNSELNVNVEIELLKDSPIVNFKVDTVNFADEHRLRVLFKTDIKAKESLADQQFGTIKRPVVIDEVNEWVEKGFDEKPRTIEPMQSFVTISDNTKGLVVFTDCVREYQIIGDEFDTIALTLFRSVPYMGKANLKDRPGRASGMPWPTPDAELKKKLSFNFSIQLYNQDVKVNDIAKLAKELFTPISYYQSAHFKNNACYFVLRERERTLPLSNSLLSFEINDNVLSALKKHENSDGLIIRLYNPSSEICSNEEIKCNFDYEDVSLVKLDEVTKVEQLEDSDIIKLNDIKKIQFKTVLIK